MLRRTIAHILPWANVAGTEVATVRLAEAARTSGYDNLLYVPELPGAGAIEAYAAARDLPTVRYRQVTPERRRPWPYLANVARMTADFRQRRIGLVHCGDLDGAYFSALAGRLSGAKVVCHVRCDAPRLTALERLLLKPVQRYVFVSRNTMANQDFPFDPTRAAVLYDGIDAPRLALDAAAARAFYGLPASAFVVGMAARFNAQKDHATLIRATALAAARQPGLHVLLAGAHDSAAAAILQGLEALMDADTRARVHFAGFEPQMDRFYAAIDAKVLSTHYEGLPLVIIEAMAAGKPVIATAVSGIPEVVADGETGLLVPPGRPDALAQAILRLAEDPALAGRMGEAGRQRAARQFSTESFTQAVAQLYGHILGPLPRVTPP